MARRLWPRNHVSQVRRRPVDQVRQCSSATPSLPRMLYGARSSYFVRRTPYSVYYTGKDSNIEDKEALTVTNKPGTSVEVPAPSFRRSLISNDCRNLKREDGTGDPCRSATSINSPSLLITSASPREENLVRTDSSKSTMLEQPSLRR